MQGTRNYLAIVIKKKKETIWQLYICMTKSSYSIFKESLGRVNPSESRTGPCPPPPPLSPSPSFSTKPPKNFPNHMVSGGAVAYHKMSPSVFLIFLVTVPLLPHSALSNPLGTH